MHNQVISTPLRSLLGAICECIKRLVVSFSVTEAERETCAVRYENASSLPSLVTRPSPSRFLATWHRDPMTCSPDPSRLKIMQSRRPAAPERSRQFSRRSMELKLAAFTGWP